jgi:hypothetical protein
VRRKAIHEQEYQSPHSTLCFINKYIADLALTPDKKQPTLSGISESQVQRWKPLGSGWVKVNVDAAISRNSERGALAAICRDHTGMFLGASAVIIEDLSPVLLPESRDSPRI